MLHDLYPVLVLYKCRLEMSKSYQTLLKGHFFDFLVYDNSPASYPQPSADEYAVLGATYVRDVENGGLPAAYNLGARRAKELGYERLLLLDADTEFLPGAVEAYRATRGCDALVCPHVTTRQGQPFSPCYIKGFSHRVRHLSDGEFSLFDYAAINSGLCIPLALFEQAGGYSSAVRLDFADFQFQQRARQWQPRLLLVAAYAVQDFSNEETDADKLLTRFRLYLESARACQHPTALQRLAHKVTILRHTLALTQRCRSLEFLKIYLRLKD